MWQKVKSWWLNPTGQFIWHTALYFIIILLLVYLYSYRGVTNSHFIYNEF